MMAKLSRRDIAIIPYLRQNSRISLTTLSRKSRIPVSTLHCKLKSFVSSGLIRPTALLDFELLGFAARVLVAVKLDRGAREEAEAFFLQNLQVNSFMRINNGFTFMADVFFSDMRAAEDFLEDLDAKFKIRRKMVFYVLGELKREAFLADPATADAVLSGSFPLADTEPKGLNT